MIRSLPALLFALALASLVSAQSSSPGRSPGQPTPDKVKAGIAHFERALYDLTPNKRDAEASVEFDQAIASFEGALTDTPRSVEAHTYLARILTLRKEFKKAAGHYDDVAALQPANPDPCVFAAGAYADAGEFEEARARLKEARLRTDDPGALARIDGYLAKLDALKK